jgi:hypothetical protein
VKVIHHLVLSATSKRYIRVSSKTVELNLSYDVYSSDYTEDGGSMFIQNIGNSLPHHPEIIRVEAPGSCGNWITTYMTK